MTLKIGFVSPRQYQETEMFADNPDSLHTGNSFQSIQIHLEATSHREEKRYSPGQEKRISCCVADDLIICKRILQ